MNEVSSNRPLISSPLISLILAAIVILTAVLYYRTLYETMQICLSHDDYSHGVLLPFISAYMIWHQGWTLKPTSPLHANVQQSSHVPFSVTGLLILIGGVALYIVGNTAGLLYPMWLSFFPVSSGLLLLLFGTRAALPYILPLCVNFMAKPFPDVLLPKLFGGFQALAAQVSAYVLELLAIPVYLRGNVIEIPGMQLLVEEACSGMRSLMALLTVAVVVIFLVRNRPIIQGLLIAFSTCIALALNIFRVTATGVMAYFWGREPAQGFMHSFSGMVTFLLGLAILYYLARALARLTGAADSKL